MSCLVTPEVQSSLRKKIVKDLMSKAQAGTPIVLSDYVKEIYTYVKDRTDNEALSLDAASLVPILLSQILSVSPTVVEILKKVNPKIQLETVTIQMSFEESLENVREVLGQKEPVAEQLADAQRQVDFVPSTPVNQVLITEMFPGESDIADKSLKSFDKEMLNTTDPKSPDYFKPDPDQVRKFSVMRNIQSELQKQVKLNNITDSSNMTLPGLEGGVFGRLVLAPRLVAEKGTLATGLDDKKRFFDKDVVMVLVDQYGSPINFTDAGDVAAEGKLAVYTVGPVSPGVMKYLVNNPTGFLSSVIKPGANTRPILNSYNPSRLNAIDFKGTKPKFVLPLTEQAAGSEYTQSFATTEVPGVDFKIPVQNPSIKDRPEVMSDIIKLLTSELYEMRSGKKVQVTSKKRMELVKQFANLKDVWFKGEAVDGVYTLIIGPDSVKIKFDGSPEASDMQKEASEKLEDYLKKPFFTSVRLKDKNGNPFFATDKDLSGSNKIKTYTDLGANIVDSINDPNASSKSILRKQRVDAAGKTVSTYHFLYEHMLSPQSKNLNENSYDKPSFQEVDGKTLLVVESKDYNEFIKNEFETAVVIVNGNPQTTTPSLSIGYTNKQVALMTQAEAEVIKPGNTNEAYKGKVVYVSPGSGKTIYSETTENVVDGDVITFAMMQQLVPSFELLPGEEVRQAPYRFFNEYPKLFNQAYVLGTAQIEKLVAEGKTVLVGSKHYLPISDFVYLQTDPKKRREKYPLDKEKMAIKASGKTPIEVTEYVKDFIGKTPKEISGDRSIQPSAILSELLESIEKDRAWHLKRGAMHGSDGFWYDASKEEINAFYDNKILNAKASTLVKSVEQSTSVKPTIDLNREWRGDLESRPVYTAEGVNTMRSSATNAFTNFGNPFSEAGYGGTIKVPSIGAAVIAYKEWLLGTNHKDVKPQQREWILNEINQGKLDGATLLYAGKSAARGQGMHPTALAEVVEQLRSKTTQPSTGVKIEPTDKIIFGHPGIGKTELRKNGRTDIIDFDSDYKTEINKKFNLPEGFKARNAFQKSNKEEYNQAVRELWGKAKEEAKRTGKTLLASDMILLREFASDFDKVITMSKETFIDRAKQRNDFNPGPEGTEGWKNSLDKEISKVPVSKVITTDKYLSDLLSTQPSASVKRVYQGYDTIEAREFEYFTSDQKEAKDYGKNIIQVDLDTTGFLKSTDPNYRTLINEFNKAGKTFDILDNSKEGLAIQNDFFRFLKAKGYKGLDMLGSIDNKYAVSFTTQASTLVKLVEQPKVEVTITTTPSGDINIYAGTGENADLSNFAERPFIGTILGGLGGQKFTSVEQAFQYAKGEFYNIYEIDPSSSKTPADLKKVVDNHLKDILNAKTGAQAKALGKKDIGVSFEKDMWDDKSSAIMKKLIKESFQQNPDALAKLLATGNLTLTHTQDKGKWGKEFPKLLMEVRDELKNSAGVTVITNEPVIQELPQDVKTDDITKTILNDDRYLERSAIQKSMAAKVTEAQMKEAEAWYAKSPLSAKFPFKVMFAAINSNRPGPSAQWAVQGVTLFSYYAENAKDRATKVDYSDLYHEAWHGFTQTFLTKAQREELYSEVRKKKGTFTDYAGFTVSFKHAKAWQLEEYLAEDFRKFMLSGGIVADKASPVKNTLFRRILNFLKDLFFGVPSSRAALAPMSIPLVAELYNKLKVGDLSSYNYDVNNRDNSIGRIANAMQFSNKEQPLTELGYEDSNLLVSTVDSIISTIINDLNRKKGLALYTTQVMKQDPMQIYKAVKVELETNVLDNLLAKREKAETQFDQMRIDQRIELVKQAIANFGNLDSAKENIVSGKDVIGYHMMKSKFISMEDKDGFLDEITESEDVAKSLKDFDRLGNESNGKDIMTTDVHYVLRSLHKYNEDGTPALNELGVQEMMDYDIVWNRLARLLGGELSRPKMWEKMAEESKNDPVIKELLEKLGSVNPVNNATVNLYAQFYNTFNLAYIPLVQMTVEQETRQVGDVVRVLDNYTVRIGTAHSIFKKTGNLWKNTFDIVSTNPYILRDLDTTSETYNANYLDVPAILNEFGTIERGVLVLKKDSEFEFFKAIGINLSNKTQIKDGVKNGIGSAPTIFSRLRILNNGRSITRMYSLDDVFREYPEEKDLKLSAMTANTADFNALAELETRYSDTANNFGVTNAKGDMQFEQSLHNTISIMTSTVNNVKTYAELIALPYMKHLDINKNPMAYASAMDGWLGSIFDMNDYAETGIGVKKKQKPSDPNSPDVTMNLQNLSGVKLINDAGKDVGEASSKSDEFTKLILDFHLSTMTGRPELMRHADKSTSFSVWISGTKSQYVSTESLIEDEAGVPGYDKAALKLRRYLNAEMIRIGKMKEMSKEKDLEYDELYLNQGQKFIIFEGVLSEDTIEKLSKHDNLDTITPELSAKIDQEIAEYFESQKEDVEKLMKGKSFISKKLINGLTSKTVNNKMATDALVRSFVVNSWIHNIESMSMIYGDIAMYKHQKEEFHKRNAGSGSTGTLFDTSLIDYVNSKGMLYAANNKLIETTLNRNGSYNSAVLKDNEIPSKYIESIGKALVEDEMKKSKITQKEAEEKILGVGGTYKEPAKGSVMYGYFKMNEGDAQGWITFDFYRALSMMEGKWSIEQDRLYRDICEGKPVDNKKVAQFFPARKLQYWGPLATKDTQPPLTAFHKFSLVPLIPTMIEGTNLKKLHHKMINEGVGYAMFESGSKISTIRKIENGKAIKDEFYSNDEAHTFSDKPFTINTTFLQFLKNQLEIAPEYKSKVTFPTQMRKLIENGMMEGGVPTDFNMDLPLEERITLWDKLDPDQKLANSKRYQKIKKYEYDIAKLTELKTEQLIKKMDLKVDAEGNVLITEINDKMKKFLVDQLSTQDLAEHELDFIRVTKTGAISTDFSLSLSADKLEKVMTAIVTKNLIRQKMNGEALVQVSGAGFESTLRGALTPAEAAKYGTNGLPFYNQKTIDFNDKYKGFTKDQLKAESEKLESQREQVTYWSDSYKNAYYTELAYIEAMLAGKKPKVTEVRNPTSPMKVKIALQGDFKNLLYLNHKDGQPIETRERLNEMLKDEEWLNTGHNRKMISIIGPRIPVQGLNSMEFAEVYEFLPTEAGNIVVLPSEIVAKAGSDFDIDKLTFMMPNIFASPDKKYWESANGKAKLEKLKAANEDPELDFSADNLKRVFTVEKADRTEIDIKLITVLNNNGVPKVTYPSGNTVEGLENRILQNMLDILQMPENFADLIRPNGTDIVATLADEMAKEVMEFNPRVDRFGKTKANLPGTRVFEIRYNLYKHASNAVGKQTLGLGAVDNTYNSIFNRIGLKLNPFFNKSGIKESVRAEILLEHNKIGDGISMSHLTDAQGKNRISDVISQLMNGWVDVAKDAWIFNLQGNKEVSPALLFMVQAGVPIKQAVYFVSHPLIRKYITEQKLAKSIFAEPLGKAPDDNPSFYQAKARDTMYRELAKGGFLDEEIIKEGRTVAEHVNNVTLDLTGANGTEKDFFSKDKVESNLLGRVKALSKLEDEDLMKSLSPKDVATFLHYLEIEDMGKVIRDIKLNTNFDTSRSKDSFEVHNKMIALDKLQGNSLLQPDLLDKIVAESPIGSFYYVLEFQSKFLKPFFKLRNNDVFTSFIRAKLKDSKTKKIADKLFGDTETMTTQFRSDFTSFIFQNYLKKFDLDEVIKTGYNGIDTVTTVKTTPFLSQGVFVAPNKEGKLQVNVDRLTLKKNYTNLSQNPEQTLTLQDGTVVELAYLNPAAFPTSESYFAFIFEREMLRSRYPGETGWKLFQERSDVQDKLKEYQERMPQLEGESAETRTARINTLVYEETLRDMALDNTYNTYKMFMGRDNMANELVQIQSKYPEMMKNYSLVNLLGTSIAKNPRMANIIMTDSFLDADKLNILNQNLRELSDPSRIKLSAESHIEKERVSDFFQRLSTYAFLQSGLKASGPYSLVRMVPQERFTTAMKAYSDEFLKNINLVTLEKYWNRFIQINSQKNLKYRFRDYTLNNFDPKADMKLFTANLTSAGLSRPLSELVDVEEDPTRFERDNAGNLLFYPNEGLNSNGDTVLPLVRSEADVLLKNNPDYDFVVSGSADNARGDGSNKGEDALINASEELGNVTRFPVRKSFGSDFTDMQAEEAQAVQAELEKNFTVDEGYQYYGGKYRIKVVNGIGIDVIGYKGKSDKKATILSNYNKNPDIDVQNGKRFRGQAASTQTTSGPKTTVVPKGANPSNKVIFETEDKIYLMNDGQQAAYDKIKSFLLEKLQKRGAVSIGDMDPVSFTSDLNKAFTGIIPKAMWNNMIGLVGRGGVGKTTVIKKVLEDVSKEAGRFVNIKYAAPTHNATTMLQEALGINSEGTEGVSTTASLTFRNLAAGSDNVELTDKPAGKDPLYLTSADKYEKDLNAGYIEPISGADIIVIDESSMIDKQFIKDLLFRFSSEAKNRGGRKMPLFIFMGDYRQLPPVDPNASNKDFKEGVISGTLFSDSNSNKFAELDQVMRSDNEAFHKIFDSIGSQITEQRKDVDKGKAPRDFTFEQYDKLTEASTENMLVANQKHINSIVDMYTEELMNNDDPYNMFWTHYNNIERPVTQALFEMIRKNYFEKMGKEVPKEKIFIGKNKEGENIFRNEVGIGDYVEYTGNFPFETKRDADLDIHPGLVKPRARFKVLDIIEGEMSLKQLNPTLAKYGNANSMIKTKTYVLYNRQGKKRIVSTPANPGTLTKLEYDKVNSIQVYGLKDSSGVINKIRVPYHLVKDPAVIGKIMSVNGVFENNFIPSYVGSTHTVQGASIKKIIVGDYNIRQNMGGPSMRDIEASLYTGLTRAAEKLIIIKPNAIAVEDNQSVFKLNKIEPLPGQPGTGAEKIEEEALEGEFPETTDTEEGAQPINGPVINPDTKALIDNVVHSMRKKKEAGKELVFPATGIGQNLIGADPKTGLLPEDKKIKTEAKATFVYLSQQLFKHFGYVNPNMSEVMYGEKIPDPTQQDVDVTNDMVRDALSFCFSEF
jgi:predicted NAD-dependent protein-ADP-ribosyltransferase YbiA (DUF1768 family)